MEWGNKMYDRPSIDLTIDFKYVVHNGLHYTYKKLCCFNIYNINIFNINQCSATTECNRTLPHLRDLNNNDFQHRFI